MPGVLVAEALAQTAGVVYLSADAKEDGSHLYLVGMDKMRFRRLVRPGDTLRLEVTVTQTRRTLWKFDVIATVDGERVATGTLLASGDRVE